MITAAYGLLTTTTCADSGATAE
eukprot:COSAG02_NODE_22000_length_767_cov_1.155689_1_plen_22_part_10